MLLTFALDLRCNSGGADFPVGTGFVQASGNGSASPLTVAPTAPTRTPQATPTMVIAPGTLDNITCLQCMFETFSV
jgi:hypothetical protein